MYLDVITKAVEMRHVTFDNEVLADLTEIQASKRQ